MRESPLAVCLGELGWLPEELSSRLNARHGRGTVGATTPYSWLAGRTPRGQIPYQVADLVSDHLGRHVDAVDLWSDLRRPRVATGSVIFTASWTEDLMRATAREIVRHQALGRPFSLPTSTTLQHLVKTWLSAPTEKPKGTNEGVPNLREMLTLLPGRSSTLLSFNAMYGGLRSQLLADHELAFVARLIAESQSDPAMAPALYRMFAEIAATSGYIAMDAGQRGNAHAYWMAGLRAAKLAADLPTASYIISALSLDLTMNGSSRLGQYMAETAGKLVRSQPTSAVHFIAAAHEALAWASMKEEVATRRALGAANQLFLDHDPTVTPPCASTATVDTVNSFSGHSLLLLNRIDEACPHLEKVLKATDAHKRSRSAGEQAFLLAGASLTKGDNEACAFFTHRGVELASQVDSCTLARQGTSLLRQFIPHMRSAEIRDASENLKLYLSRGAGA